MEGEVLIVQRYVLARLRNRQFFGLVELNTAIRAVVADLNAKVMRKIGSSRNELLATIDRPALKPLPAEPHVYADWKLCKLGLDYHVEIDQHYYSAPHRLIRERIEARITDATVEIFHKGARVASHVRSAVKRRHTTISEHMPSSHRHYADWTPERIMREAAVIGPAMIALVEAIMKTKAHPEQGFRACKGILQLAKSYSVTRMEAAAMRGVMPEACFATTTSAPSATVRSSRSCRTASTKLTPSRQRRRLPRSSTPTSVVGTTTTDQASDRVLRKGPRLAARER